jgi:hypothetical protein
MVVDSRPEAATERFSVGIRFPEFVHVLNRTALDTLFECFDTTVDLVHYLHEKEKLFSARAGIWVSGEEDLIALYTRSLLLAERGSLSNLAQAANQTARVGVSSGRCQGI